MSQSRNPILSRIAALGLLAASAILAAILAAIAAGPAAAQAPAAPQGAGEGPSFDCARARAWDERTICGDRTLSTLDRRIATAYAGLRGATPAGAERSRIEREQRAWLASRRACERPASGSAIECLRAAMSQRVAALEASARPATAAKPPASPAAATPQAAPDVRAVDCAADARPIAKVICAQPLLRELEEQMVELLRPFLVNPAHNAGTVAQSVRDWAGINQALERCERPVGRMPVDCLTDVYDRLIANLTARRAREAALSRQGAQGAGTSTTTIAPRPAGR
ncbi:MAG: DUF1311 domain-containing protein [Alphaproteobacteria bacterium]|nr:DUF1311 domain-containing protein [Alphaproteobacteria bacterium]